MGMVKSISTMVHTWDSYEDLLFGPLLRIIVVSQDSDQTVSKISCELALPNAT
ncbi:predicted protein [Botrytis cinerea T4]|uniref:Uncharacterized protein n=1 Tax=Botryotinia fuckeliana (strain T4) TaxID=999810 RepID=G2YZC1_BOTF4|nr:predicted protein [Botrytis cinerea T4]